MRTLGGILAALTLSLAACSSSGGGPAASTPASTSSAAAKTVLVTGTVVLNGQYARRDDDPKGSPCYAAGNSPAFGSPTPYDDVKAGAQVVISDAGKTVGLGTLGDGKTAAPVTGGSGHPDCTFSFAVSGVAAGGDFYTIKVGTHSMQIPGSSIEQPTITFG